METVSDFILGASKITADGDCSHEIKRCLLLGRKVMTNLDSILKTEIMASGPITSWEIGWETVETVSDFIFLGSEITADVDCSHEIKDNYSLERKL